MPKFRAHHQINKLCILWFFVIFLTRFVFASLSDAVTCSRSARCALLIGFLLLVRLRRCRDDDYLSVSRVILVYRPVGDDRRREKCSFVWLLSSSLLSADYYYLYFP